MASPLKADGQVLALSLLTAGEMAHAYSAFLPSRFTIRNWVLDGSEEKQAQNISDLRSGYIPALIFGLGLGGVVSYIARSTLPLIFSGVTGVAMLALYEQALPSHKQLHKHLMRKCGLLDNVPLTMTPTSEVIDLLANEWWVAA